MEDFRWVWGLLIAAYYIYSAYRNSQKKKEKEIKEQQGENQPVTKRITTATEPIPTRDIFKELFGDQPQPKPAPQQQKIKQPTVKPSTKSKPVFVHREVVPNANTNTTADIHTDSLKEAKDAYAIGIEGDAHSFNLRDAVIANIILNRPEY